MISSDLGQVLAFQRVEERDGRMVVELHFAKSSEKEATRPLPPTSKPAELPMLMLWNGEMELGPLALPSFRRGIAMGSLTGITHVRLLPSYDWTKIGNFSGADFRTGASGAYISPAVTARSEEEQEGKYFYGPLSPYRWLGGWAAAWALVSLIGMMLPVSFALWVVMSVIAATVLAVCSMILNHSARDLCVPLICLALVLLWSMTREKEEHITLHVDTAPGVELVSKASNLGLASPDLQRLHDKPTLADLPELEAPKLLGDWR